MISFDTQKIVFVHLKADIIVVSDCELQSKYGRNDAESLTMAGQRDVDGVTASNISRRPFKSHIYR